MSEARDLRNSVLRGELWPRFEAYELDGGLIRPKAGAKVEWYDPWLAEEERRIEGDSEPPRNSILRIVDRILEPAVRAAQLADARLSKMQAQAFVAFDHPPVEDLGKTLGRELLHWCAQNGLLGLLHHQLLQVTLPPAYTVPHERTDSRVRPGEKLFYARQEYLRAEATGWWRSGYWSTAPGSADARRGDPVPAARWSKRVHRPRGAYRRIIDGAISTEPLPGRWTRYFRDLPVEKAVAVLDSEEGWRGYGEPLDDLVSAIAVLSFALRQIASRRTSGARRAADLTEGEFRAYNWHIRLVATMAWPATPAPYIDAHLNPRPRWSSPSLLGSLAMQTLLDLYGGYAAVVCKNCGTVFLSKAPQAKFCTTRCRFTYHKREWRRGQTAAWDAT
jgi:hypothetical protein